MRLLLMPTESTAEKLNIDGLLSLVINRQDIEANFIRSFGQRQKVLTCQAAQHPRLVAIDSGFRRGNVPAGARFYFNKAERVAFPRHQVKIPPSLSTTPVARHHCIAAAAKEEEGCFLPTAPELQVRCPPFPQASGEVVGGVNKLLKQPEG